MADILDMDDEKAMELLAEMDEDFDNVTEGFDDPDTEGFGCAGEADFGDGDDSDADDADGDSEDDDDLADDDDGDESDLD